jgi:CheY-like chemotaxis protein
VPGPAKQRKNVLLVEDYEPNIIVAGSMLENLGCDYDVACNGFEALRKFAQGYYDVILMDVQMHGLDGLEATRKIRRLEADKGLERTPVIAMTAHAREQDKDKCIEAGMDDFLPKPFEPASLARKMARYMQLKAEAGQMEKTARAGEK